MDANYEEDLPLSANFKQFAVDHYYLSLNCDMKKRMFTNCKVVIAVRNGSDWRRDDKKLILDCSDLNIRTVNILDYPLREGESCKNVKIRELLARPSQDLNFDLSEWCIEIDVSSKEASLDAGGTIFVMIEYDTRVETRSLHWRQGSGGDICVYTAAASINNRGLFPCQVMRRQHLVIDLVRIDC